MKRSAYRRFMDGLRSALMYIAIAIVCALLVGVIGYIFVRGIPHISWEFLSTKPSPRSGTIGILPDLLNTLYIILMTIVIVLPLGVGAAIYLTEYAKNKKLVRVIEFATETLSGIPSIIFGLVGMLVFVEFFGLQSSLIAGALTLVILTLPTVVRTTQESLKTVPQSYREGALGLGSGKWHMIRTVVLPSSVDGIVTGCILAIGRIVGESAALLYTAGVAHNILSLAQAVMPNTPGSTLTVALYMYASERAEFDSAFAIATILLILTFIINLAAKIAGKRLRKSEDLGGKSTMGIIETKDLHLWYGNFEALKGITLDIPAHEITALIGPSGCGKSTYLKTLNRMNDLVEGCRVEGEVKLEGEDIYKGMDVNQLRKRVGMVFQKANPFPMSIYDNVAYGPRIHGIRNKAKLDMIVERSLRQAAIWDEVKDRLKKNALGMSGGQQQRLCIARALAVEPEVLLMDESTSALDPISTSKIEDLAVELKKDYTIIMVTHNMQQAARISDNTAFFLLGEMVEFGKTEMLFSMPKDKRTEDYITGRFG